MATTTNYGWTTPDDTALVKDGAAAIRTLGSSVDTTTKALNPSTTLGDIEYRSSTANTNTRLGIGTTGQVLSVSGGVPSWATPASGSLTLLSTSSLSGVASVAVSSISQSYKHLYIEVENPYNTDNATDLRFTFNNDTSDVYGNSGMYSQNINSSPYNSFQADTTPRVDDPTNTNMASTNTYNFHTLLIYNYASGTSSHFYERRGRTRSSGGAVGVGMAVGTWDVSASATAAITRIDCLNGSAASNFGGGTMRIYGVN
jgi:hypothetical protein